MSPWLKRTGPQGLDLARTEQSRTSVSVFVPGNLAQCQSDGSWQRHVPSDIVRHIFSYLEEKDTHSILSRCLSVSSSMFDVAAPLLYRRLVIPNGLRKSPIDRAKPAKKWHDPSQTILKKRFQKIHLLETFVEELHLPGLEVIPYCDNLKVAFAKSNIKKVVFDTMYLDDQIELCCSPRHCAQKAPCFGFTGLQPKRIVFKQVMMSQMYHHPRHLPHDTDLHSHSLGEFHSLQAISLYVHPAKPYDWTNQTRTLHFRPDNPKTPAKYDKCLFSCLADYKGPLCIVFAGRQGTRARSTPNQPSELVSSFTKGRLMVDESKDVPEDRDFRRAYWPSWLSDFFETVLDAVLSTNSDIAIVDIDITKPESLDNTDASTYQTRAEAFLHWVLATRIMPDKEKERIKAKLGQVKFAHSELSRSSGGN